ncbi:MAG: hypothetical protein PHE67_09880 [Campylobacterales bacterium]|jgi:hypothetical protein|nr:hypothetical protein [Campylobacterales bacterium]
MKTLTPREQLMIIVRLHNQNGFEVFMESLLSIDSKDQDAIISELLEILKMFELGKIMNNDLHTLNDMLCDVRGR